MTLEIAMALLVIISSGGLALCAIGWILYSARQQVKNIKDFHRGDE